MYGQLPGVAGCSLSPKEATAGIEAGTKAETVEEWLPTGLFPMACSTDFLMIQDHLRGMVYHPQWPSSPIAIIN